MSPVPRVEQFTSAITAQGDIRGDRCGAIGAGGALDDGEVIIADTRYIANGCVDTVYACKRRGMGLDFRDKTVQCGGISGRLNENSGAVVGHGAGDIKLYR